MTLPAGPGCSIRSGRGRFGSLPIRINKAIRPRFSFTAMHYYPSTYNEIMDCVMQTKNLALRQGRRPVGMVLGEFQHRMIVDHFKYAMVPAGPVQMTQGTGTFCGIPFEIRGSYGFAMQVA